MSPLTVTSLNSDTPPNLLSSTSKTPHFFNMQFSTTFIALFSAFVASSAAQGTLSFTISTCAACSTASGCLVEVSTNLPANRCISIYDGNKSLIITEAANPNCKSKFLY